MIKAFFDALLRILEVIGAFYAGKLSEKNDQVIEDLQVKDRANEIRFSNLGKPDADIMRSLISEYGRPMPEPSNSNNITNGQAND